MSGETTIEQAAKEKTATRGIVRDERGQDQPADKKAAQTMGKPTKPTEPPGQREQEEAAETTPMYPGEPAGGE